MKKLALAGVCVVAALVWWPTRDDSKLVFDRFWVDHLPRNASDPFQALFLLGERPFGQFATQTPWRGQWEAFHYHIVARGDGELDLIFPASNEQQRVRLRARECKERREFDYCLEVTGSSRGSQRYYSKREWDKKDVDAIRAQLAQ